MIPVFIFEDANQQTIDHRFTFEEVTEDRIELLIQSSGGKRHDGTGYNSGYNQGLERLFYVLNSQNIEIDSIHLDTQTTRKLKLSHKIRELEIPFSYMEPKKLRISLAGQMKNIGSTSSSDSGNGQKRIKITLINCFNTLNKHVIAPQLSARFEKYKSAKKFPTGLNLNGESILFPSQSEEGWLYVLRNPQWNEWIKIGSTRDLNHRYCLYNSNVPIEDYYFDFSTQIYHSSASKIEQKLHESLNLEHLTGNTDGWYKLSSKEATKIILKQIDLFDTINSLAKA